MQGKRLLKGGGVGTKKKKSEPPQTKRVPTLLPKASTTKQGQDTRGEGLSRVTDRGGRYCDSRQNQREVRTKKKKKRGVRREERHRGGKEKGGSVSHRPSARV